jgi:hypothetical protein
MSLQNFPEALYGACLKLDETGRGQIFVRSPFVPQGPHRYDHVSLRNVVQYAASSAAHNHLHTAAIEHLRHHGDGTGGHHRLNGADFRSVYSEPIYMKILHFRDIGSYLFSPVSLYCPGKHFLKKCHQTKPWKTPESTLSPAVSVRFGSISVGIDDGDFVRTVF